MTPDIEILIVGNEILSGRTVDRNSAYLINSLAGKGFPVRYISVAGDIKSDLVGALKTACKRADIVLVSGGLGPTSDDITVEAVCEAFGRKQVFDEGVWQKIEELFRLRKRFMSDSNRKQAFIPEGAVPLRNPGGTAPGILLESGGKSIYLMPGVPSELQTIFKTEILPRIAVSFESAHIKTAGVIVTGISESEVFDRVKHLPGAKEYLAYYPTPEGITISIRTPDDAPADAFELQMRITEILGDVVFSSTGESLEKIVGNMLIEKNLTLGIAESCTGGLIANRITNIPGSSNYFLCGVVTYSNASKEKILGIDRDSICSHGAVSKEVAAAMAERIRIISGADIGISTTGIAGPGGGSDEKPVGYMFAGYSTVSGTETQKFQFIEDRLINKSRMSQAVLDILRLHLKRDYKE
ncbi:MAG: competence/damage-inducible protein A [Candidatus Latescibacterota bacterium]